MHLAAAWYVGSSQTRDKPCLLQWQAVTLNHQEPQVKCFFIFIRSLIKKIHKGVSNFGASIFQCLTSSDTFSLTVLMYKKLKKQCRHFLSRNRFYSFNLAAKFSLCDLRVGITWYIFTDCQIATKNITSLFSKGSHIIEPML